jgi:hypothetical protein
MDDMMTLKQISVIGGDVRLLTLRSCCRVAGWLLKMPCCFVSKTENQHQDQKSKMLNIYAKMQNANWRRGGRSVVTVREMYGDGASGCGY